MDELVRKAGGGGCHADEKLADPLMRTVFFLSKRGNMWYAGRPGDQCVAVAVPDEVFLSASNEFACFPRPFGNATSLE